MRKGTWRGLCRLGVVLGLLCTVHAARANLPLPQGGVTIDFTGFTGAGFAPEPAAGQLDSDYWAVTGLSDGALDFGGTATSGDYTGTTASGGVTDGGFYALTGESTRLMLQPSGADWTPGTLTLRLQNATGQALPGFRLSYALYVNNDQGWSNSFNVSYSTNGTVFTSIPERDYSSPVAADANGFVQITSPPTATAIEIDVDIPVDGFLYIRWSGADVSGSGSRDEFALDDIVIVPVVDDGVDAISISTLGGQPYSQDLNTLAKTGLLNTTQPAGWTYSEGTFTTPNEDYAATDGTDTDPNTYSVGLNDTDSDRALGQIWGSQFDPYRIGVAFRNDTGQTLNELSISYVGEQWRWGGDADGRGTTPDRIDFQYSFDATKVNDESATWIDFHALDFLSPVTSGTPGALNGNLPENKVAFDETITGLTIPPGTIIFLRWEDSDVVGAEDLLAVDDFAFGVDVTPPPEPALVVIKDDNVTLPVLASEGYSYEILVDHDVDSEDAATNVVVVDTLPAGVTLLPDLLIDVEPGSVDDALITIDDDGTDGVSFNATTRELTIDLAIVLGRPLATTESVSFIFDVTVDARTTAATLTNTVDLDYVGVTSGNAHTASDSADTDVIACDGNEDCSDGDDCTTDTCDAGSCVFPPLCADTDACTIDLCAGGICDNTQQVDCSDDNPCTEFITCDTDLGCQYDETAAPACFPETGFTIAQWTFEVSAPSATNSTTITGLNAEVGTGVASGVHVNPATDWPEFVGNGSATSFAANTWQMGDYYQFETSTIGYDTIKLTWDQTRTSTAPATWNVLVSHDGETFEPLVEAFTVGQDSWSSNPANYNPDSHFGPVALGPQFSDRQTLVVRIVAHETNGTGNVRVDNVTIGGLPITDEPHPREPHLEAIKADDVTATAAIPGDIVIYEILVDHNATSTRTAVDIEIEDQLPDGLTASDLDMELELTDGTIVPLTVADDGDDGEISVDGLITVRLAELGLTESATLSVLVSVDPRTSAADLLNTATITWFDHADGGPYIVLSNTESTPVAECIGDDNCTSACLDNAVCTNGTCTGDAVTCNDSKSCTTDTCDPATGCVFQPVDLACDDGFGCTTDACDPDDGDSNVTTGCVITPDDDLCDDSVGCTDDTCSTATGCVNTPNNDNCDDDDACNGVETCDLTNDCQPGTTLDCDDGVDCTDDSCVAAIGCVSTTNDANCDDDDTCNGTETCHITDGCQAGTTLDCDDGVDCTDDSCDPTGGCANTANDDHCDDDDACNGTETCDVTNDCQPGTALNCVDTNPCTDDSCNPASGCVNAPDNTNSCADTNLCNGTETCNNGTCTAGTAVVCNDNNPCTNDSCNPATGSCAFANNTDSCNDNNANTHTDTCTSGTCVGTAVVCDTPNQCQTIGTPNGTASCPPVNKVNGTACDDNSLTTHTDVCTAGVCAGTTIVCPAPGTCELAGTPNGVDCTKNFAAANTPCNDDDLTTATDVCDGAGVCAGTTIVCPTPTQCQTAGTPDGTTCVPVNKPATEPCDDGDVATSGDTCDGAGACVGTAIVCPEDTACGTYAPNGVDCTLTPLTGACDDGDVNTHTDTCVEGSCQGTAYACVPSQCELDSVANGTDCTVTFKDAATACDDGDVNTRDDVCDGAGACAGDAYTCTPGVCEASSVPDGTGCVVTPSLPGDSCEDGDPCTSDDVCDTAGLCMGEAVVCGDGELCGDDGTCRLTHCTTCAEDGECGANSTCVALEAGNRCLVTCETDLDCALNQTCAATEDGAMHCFDLTGTCAAPVVNPEEEPEVIEPGPEIAEPEPEPEEVEPEPEPEEVEPLPEEEPEVGPEPVETVEPVEPAPDAAAEAEDDKVVASGGGCSGGGTTSGALALLVGALALAGMRRRQTR